MIYRLAELAREVGGAVEGDGERPIEGLQGLEDAGPRELSFLNHPRYRHLASRSRAGALLVGPRMASAARRAGKDLLLAEEPSWALARLQILFHPPVTYPPGIHPTAVVEEGAGVDPEAHVGPYAVIGAGSRVEAGAALLAGVVVGRDCRVAAGAVLHPRVVLYDRTEIGEGAVLHAGAVVGSDGFGYAHHRGEHVKIPQAGRAVVEAGVEIGANTTVDRATFGETRIGEGSKLDNLVQVGHNVTLGPRSILCGQAGVAGSARLGAGVVMGGQSGAAGHLEVGDGVQIAAKSAVLQSVAAGSKVAGVPAVDLRQWHRQVALLGRLAERLEEMERRLLALEGTRDKEGES